MLSLAPLKGDAPVDRETAARQVVRAFVEVVGPKTVRELRELLSLGQYDVDGSLHKIESQGQVLRGQFRAASERMEGEIEWCDRRLLQRIHRLTVGRLRREIEPLSAQDYMRFLFRWHNVGPSAQARGPEGLATVIGRLQGYEAPAAAWEQELLPARMKQYVGEWLEQACFAGEVAWGRLTEREPKAAPGPRRGVDVEGPLQTKRAPMGRAANLTFARREDLDWLLQLARPHGTSPVTDEETELPTLSPVALEVLAALQTRGASFFADLQSATRKLPTEIEDALWELLACGRATADAVQNLRVLQSPKLRRMQKAQQRGGPGRWSLLNSGNSLFLDELHDRWVMLLLNRYGIVFRDVAMRETLCPPWRELLSAFRRMEARGEIRGGRFVSGFAGEQFALPEAVDLSRAVRRSPKSGETVRLSAVDPLNLTGVVTPGPRVPAVMGHYVTWVDGVPSSEVEQVPVEVLTQASVETEAPRG